MRPSRKELGGGPPTIIAASGISGIGTSGTAGAAGGRAEMSFRSTLRPLMTTPLGVTLMLEFGPHEIVTQPFLIITCGPDGSSTAAVAPAVKAPFTAVT